MHEYPFIMENRNFSSSWQTSLPRSFNSIYIFNASFYEYAHQIIVLKWRGGIFSVTRFTIKIVSTHDMQINRLPL